jgi:hypothetical protein
VVLIGALGIVTLLASGVPPDSFTVTTFNNPLGAEYLNNGTPDNTEDDYQAVFLCSEDKAKLELFIVNGETATLTAVPLENVLPELDGKLISPSSQSQMLEVQVLGEVKLTLVSPKGGGEEVIKMIPNEVCRGFPVNLIADFEGTLEQTLPEPASLPRAIEMRWRNATLEASLSGATCQLFPDEDRLLCLAGNETNPGLRLEGQVVNDTFAGSYEGFVTGTATQVNFEGTFNFVKRERE